MIGHMDPAIVAFLPVLALVLAVALVTIGVASAWLRDRQPELVRELWLRYASWVAMAAVVLGALALGRDAWSVLIALLSLASFREYARAVGLWRDGVLEVVACGLILIIHAGAWWAACSTDFPTDSMATLALLAVPVLRDRFEHMLQQVCLALLGVLCFGGMLAHVAYLLALPRGTGAVLLLLFLVSLHDVAAFVAGKLAGRHLLRPALSPRKTWEGALGALVVVQVAAQALGPLVVEWRRLELAGFAILVALGATLGDLALAMIKRDVGIKDWGSALPGHGGLLDRLNSLIFTAPICVHYVRYVLS